MAHRYRLYPTPEQADFMLDRHCADARFVWNLAVEQFNWGRSAPGSAERMTQLAEARQEFAWLGEGSSSVQQQALRDFDRAVAGSSRARMGARHGGASTCTKGSVSATQKDVC